MCSAAQMLAVADHFVWEGSAELSAMRHDAKRVLNIYFSFILPNVYARPFSGPRSVALSPLLLLILYIVHASSDGSGKPAHLCWLA